MRTLKKLTGTGNSAYLCFLPSPYSILPSLLLLCPPWLLLSLPSPPHSFFLLITFSPSVYPHYFLFLSLTPNNAFLSPILTEISLLFLDCRASPPWSSWQPRQSCSRQARLSSLLSHARSPTAGLGRPIKLLPSFGLFRSAPSKFAKALTPSLSPFAFATHP